MKVEKRLWTAAGGWQLLRAGTEAANAQVVVIFGSRGALSDPAHLPALRQAYPAARLVGCSTAGEIAGTDVLDDSIVAVALAFEHTTVRVVQQSLAGAEGSAAAGTALAQALMQGPDASTLAHVLVFSDGIHVNGSALVAGMQQQLPAHVMVTGGLAGDGAAFERTLVVCDTEVSDRTIVAVGLYGDRLRVGHGSLGGWDPFGPERMITRSEGNVLYELDGAPALSLYKSYLGAHAKDLPNSGLLFPLSIRETADGRSVVRTILAVDEAAGSLIFAGDVPQGHRAQLMKANFDRLIDGAQGAAVSAATEFGDGSPAVALLISCVGRKLVLKQRIEEEVESVRDVLGDGAALVGFYSYGEIAPGNASRCSELHNQTMTITTLDER